MEGLISHFYSGTSGLVLPVPKSQFPEEFKEASRLTYYASLFRSIEINSTFYKVPKLETVYKWAITVPDHFRFTFKMWRGITHQNGLEFNSKDVEDFMNVIGQVGTNRGCLLIQLPPRTGIECFRQLEKLLCCIVKMNMPSWQIAVEFRNSSWYGHSTWELLRSFKAVHVVHDMPGSIPPDILHTGDFAYFRFHGPAGDYKGGYPDDFLMRQAIAMRSLLMEGKEVYVYFNNTVGEALNNLMDLNQIVNSNSVKYA